MPQGKESSQPTETTRVVDGITYRVRQVPEVKPKHRRVTIDNVRDGAPRFKRGFVR